MKKFISALTSVALAATAMGSLLATNASAAVDTAILDIRSGDSNAVTVSAEDIAKGDVKVPVTIYLPQSPGVNTFSLKLAVNGDATLGQAPATHEKLFGNYGIVLAASATGCAEKPGMAAVTCLEADNEGDPSWYDAIFTPERLALFFQNQEKASTKVNCTSWSAAEATDDTTVTSWSKDEPWAYAHGLFEFDMVLPKGLADGTYVLDVYRDRYVNANSINDPTYTYGQSQVLGADGVVTYETVALTVTVGDADTTTTSASSTTTTDSKTTTSSSKTTTTTSSGSGTTTGGSTAIPNGLAYVGDVVTAQPGDTVTVGFKVYNDPGTSGMKMTFVADEGLTVERDSSTKGLAYKLLPTWNPDELIMTWAKDVAPACNEGGNLILFKVTLPADASGVYEINIDEAQSEVRRNEGGGTAVNEFTATPIKITVGGADETTTSEETTATSSGKTTTSSGKTTTSSSTTTTTTTGTVVWGDVNCDDKVSISDVVLLNKHNAQGATVSAQGLLNADCVNDKKLDSADATAIKGHLAKFYGTDAFPFKTAADVAAAMK